VEISQIQAQSINGWHDPSHKKLTRPDSGQKFLTPTHHYFLDVDMFDAQPDYVFFNILQYALWVVVTWHTWRLPQTGSWTQATGMEIWCVTYVTTLTRFIGEKQKLKGTIYLGFSKAG